MALFEGWRAAGDSGPYGSGGPLGTAAPTEEEEGLAGHRPTFKDCVAADIDLAFFNGDEHAERHHVDDKKDVLVVLEEDRTRHYGTHWEWGKKSAMDDGIYLFTTILYIKAADYGPKPKAGKELVMDAGTQRKRTYRILQCEEERGVYRMKLERVRQ